MKTWSSSIVCEQSSPGLQLDVVALFTDYFVTKISGCLRKSTRWVDFVIYFIRMGNSLSVLKFLWYKVTEYKTLHHIYLEVIMVTAISNHHGKRTNSVYLTTYYLRMWMVDNRVCELHCLCKWVTGQKCDVIVLDISKLFM